MIDAVKNPWITANQVTLLRLIPVPFLAWCFYQTPTFYWVGLILGTIIGCTDWVDGLLARKYGPTQLGALLDPMADKIFIAMVYLPMADVGMIPLWPVVLMFVREFLITALRTSFKSRDIRFKTSYLAKVKTWVQMQNVAMVLLVVLLSKTTLLVGLLTGALGAAVVAVVFGVIKKRLYTGAWIMAGCILAMAAILFFFEKEKTISIMTWTVVALTWISGLDYLVGGIPKILASGKFKSLELARIFGAVAVPLLCGWILASSENFPWPIFGLVSVELSLGGLDNFYAQNQDAVGAKPWLARILCILCFLGLALFGPARSNTLFTAGAFAVSLVGFLFEAYRGRHHYL